jgi:hypothetical protein
MRRFLYPGAFTVGVVLPSLVAACNGQQPSVGKTTGAVSTSADYTQPSCIASRFVASSAGFPEVQGLIDHPNQLWGLLFADIPLQHAQQVKIVWRMTGSGELHLSAYGPGGARVPSDWLHVHGTSTWNHPGDEWGSGFTFPRAGCWEVVASRGTLIGHVGLPVA